MKTDTIFKTVGLAGFIFGAGAIAFAMYNRNIKRKYQEATVDALVKTDIITQNFSGADGRIGKLNQKPKSYLCTDGKRKWFSRIPCPKGGGIITPADECFYIQMQIDNYKKTIEQSGSTRELELKLSLAQKLFKVKCSNDNPLGKITKDQCESHKPSGYTCLEGTDGSWRYDKL